MVDALVCDLEAGLVLVAGVEVAVPSREAAARHLKADAMPAQEDGRSGWFGGEIQCGRSMTMPVQQR